MAKVRRRVLRPESQAATQDVRLTARIAKRQQQLTKERAALRRWMTKLKRAFHVMEKQQRRIASLERQLTQLARN